MDKQRANPCKKTGNMQNSDKLTSLSLSYIDMYILMSKETKCENDNTSSTVWGMMKSFHHPFQFESETELFS